MCFIMVNNTPSSIVCFKNGYSFVCVPVTLTPSVKDASEDDDNLVKRASVGPLPEFAVHGTIGIQPLEPEQLKIFSVSKAPVKTITRESKLIIPDGNPSMSKFLEANVGKRVKMSVRVGDEPLALSLGPGKIKWVQVNDHIYRIVKESNSNI